MWLLLICIGTGACTSVLRGPPLAGTAPAGPQRGNRDPRRGSDGVGIAAAHPVQHFQDFKQTPTNLNESIHTHLFSGSSNGRWRLWTAAVDEFKDEPSGVSTRSCEAWWRSAESFPSSSVMPIRSTSKPWATGDRRACPPPRVLRHRRGGRGGGGMSGDDEHQAAVAALLAVAARYLLKRVWELTAVSVVAMVAFGLLTGQDTVPPTPFAAERTRRPLVAAWTVVVALALIVAGEVLSSPRCPSATARTPRQRTTPRRHSTTRSRRSRSSHGHVSVAPDRAPAGAPRTGRRPVRRSRRRARDQVDWRLWLVKARLETRSGLIEQARESLARARELNPHSPLLSSESASEASLDVAISPQHRSIKRTRD